MVVHEEGEPGLSLNSEVEEVKKKVLQKWLKKWVTQDVVLRPALLVNVSGLFRICWSTTKREYSCSWWVCKHLIWKTVLIRMWALIGARCADKRVHISRKTCYALWKGDISACTERQSWCSWLSSIHDFYCVMCENERFVFEPKQTETHSRPI